MVEDHRQLRSSDDGTSSSILRADLSLGRGSPEFLQLAQRGALTVFRARAVMGISNSAHTVMTKKSLA